VGYTGARHERLEAVLSDGGRRHLVLKTMRLATDWTAQRSSDAIGREAALLGERALAPVWEAVTNSYIAFAVEAGEVGLLMEDLSEHLAPDVREPIHVEQEEGLLGALATLHARFWDSPALDLPWLARAQHFAGLLDAPSAVNGDALAVLPSALRANVERGWAIALRKVPHRIAAALMTPAAEIAERWAGLPMTVVHGDSKVANCAFLPGRRVALFDWALLGAAPPTIDLGWYVAINATRLTRPKEEVIARYRALLEKELSVALPETQWEALVRAGLLCGARMLLWSKALAADAGTPAAGKEWTWWVEQIERACA
jgi:hypothetical protein